MDWIQLQLNGSIAIELHQINIHTIKTTSVLEIFYFELTVQIQLRDIPACKALITMICIFICIWNSICNTNHCNTISFGFQMILQIEIQKYFFIGIHIGIQIGIQIIVIPFHLDSKLILQIEIQKI